MSRSMLLVAMIPPALLALTRVVFLVLAVWGVHPFWLPAPLNLAEAAALRDRGEVARLLAEGKDPNATYRVRRGVVRRYAMEMTPIEAALATRRDEIVQLLLDSGATPHMPDVDGTPQPTGAAP
jgi:hypothetical protein